MVDGETIRWAREDPSPTDDTAEVLVREVVYVEAIKGPANIDLFYFSLLSASAIFL
jgi:hypothetical protein